MSSFKNGKLNKKKKTASENETKLLTVWKSRFSLPKLSNPNRVAMIMQHRQEIGGLGKFFALTGHTVSQGRVEESRMHFTNLDTINPGGKEKLPWNFSGLQPITLKNMDPYRHNSKGNMLELEIIEDAISFLRVILLGQDGAGDVMFVALYCDSPSVQDDLLQEKVGYGCKISIANPRMKIALDGRVMIKVKDNEALFIHKLKDPKKCRFCGKADSKQKCGRCKKAFYCSRECQIHDWKILKHKEICDAYVWVLNQIQT